MFDQKTGWIYIQADLFQFGNPETSQILNLSEKADVWLKNYWILSRQTFSNEATLKLAKF